MKKAVLLVCVLMATVSVVVAQKPARNINPNKRPNLAAAQRLVAQAYDKVTAAQKQNEYDLDGHAKKAKELLSEASDELKLAAQAANKR